MSTFAQKSAAAAMAGLLALSASPALAADAKGVWLRDTGKSKVRIAPCGDALCGTIAWEQTPRNDENNPDPAKRSRPLVGVQVFFNMKPAGDNRWNGSAYNPEDGKTYSGGMTLEGDKLTTKGCVLGGLICKSVSWSRSS